MAEAAGPDLVVALIAYMQMRAHFSGSVGMDVLYLRRVRSMLVTSLYAVFVPGAGALDMQSSVGPKRWLRGAVLVGAEIGRIGIRARITPGVSRRGGYGKILFSMFFSPLVICGGLPSRTVSRRRHLREISSGL